MNPTQFKPQTQLILHDPEQGQHGDCLRTCVAICLGIEPQDVPNFADPREFPDWLHGMDSWLAEREMSSFALPMATDYSTVIEQLDRTAGCVPVIITGASPRGGLHAVVFHCGQVHDPHPDGGGLVGPNPRTQLFWVRVIAPLLTTTRTHPFVMTDDAWAEASA